MNSRHNPLYFIIGMLLIVFAIVFPELSKDWTTLLLKSIGSSITNKDSGELIIAAFVYIGRGSLIFGPMYLGAMFISVFFLKNRSSVLLQLFFSFIVTLSVLLLNILYMDTNSLMTHLILILITIFLTHYIPHQKYFFLLFTLILVQIILSVQWLNLFPEITFFGFGTDDLSISIKVADDYLTSYALLNTLSVTFFILFLTIAVFFTGLIYVYSKQIRTLQRYQIQERKLREARIAAIESRAYKEIHTLVHDLKTPLVTLEGLISLFGLTVEDNAKHKEYIYRIERSVEKINDMISEILYDDVHKKIKVTEFIDYVTSHFILDEKPIEINVDVPLDLPEIEVNKIRFTRAIANVLENSVLSIGNRPGDIQLKAVSQDGGVLFSIEDDGPGIESKLIHRIWEEGFSTKNSSGFGLPFVKRVVEDHGGWININSIPNVQTRVEIFVPVKKGANENDNGTGD